MSLVPAFTGVKGSNVGDQWSPASAGVLRSRQAGTQCVCGHVWRGTLQRFLGVVRTVSSSSDLSLSPSTVFATSLQPSDIHSSDAEMTPTSPPAYPLGKSLMLVRPNKTLYLSAFLHMVPLRTFLYSEVIADSMRR